MLTEPVPFHEVPQEVIRAQFSQQASDLILFALVLFIGKEATEVRESKP